MVYTVYTRANGMTKTVESAKTLLSDGSEFGEVACDVSKAHECVEVRSSFQVDIIGDILGNCRSWQLRTILIIYLTKIPTAFFMACIVYTAPVPPRLHIHCNDTSDPTSTLMTIRHPSVVSVHDKEFDLSYCDTFSDIKDHAAMHYGHENFDVPWNSLNPIRSVIHVFNDSNPIPCDFFNFKSGKSVTTYDVVCSRGGFVVVTQGMHLVGIILSGIVLRYLLKV